ncbi:hypothetical protein M413DRAFT_449536 [Hebeloma cylindrosporum]|uniref:Protein kinase domain-containing protein n=1 Tax=Hebeloma cylindrosporum TaxID=76867 RepID=A0A0C3BWY5_HEBCY|nr:hypothetical protein M413DRAFT_449536 [Hebeloma cylindrosporum h7]
MAAEVRHEWVGPMPVKDFFDNFLKISAARLRQMPKVSNGYFDAVPKGTPRKKIRECDMYGPVIKLVEGKKLLPGFKMVNTSSTPDANSVTGKQMKQDLATYEDTVDTSINLNQLDKDTLPWELKPSSKGEPFSDPSEKATPEELANHSFETNTQDGALIRGQIAIYLTEVGARQHRTHTFLVFMTDTTVRFLRADRTGIIVTRSFHYRSNSQILAEFLWRFSQISPAQRGLDPTVRLATPAEEKVAREKLSEWAPEKFRPVVVIKVCDGKNGFREVIAWGSMSDAHSLTGRATRGWPVFDLKAKNVAFLKDSWRSDLEHLDKESSILKELTDAKVRNIPKYICGDDVPGQITRTQEFVGEAWKAGPTSESAKVKRLHHHLLTDFVGHRITKFKSSHELMKAIYDAYLAHTDAFKICGILHRDISIGNVLRSVEGNGILNDWDMARRVKDIHSGPRQPGRTGTWLFMSIKLLKDPTDLHVLQDDLESFCYLVLYIALRYLPHNKVSTLADIMKNVFENHYDLADGVCGGLGKTSMVHDRRFIGRDLKFTDNAPLTNWIEVALRIIKDWLDYRAQSSGQQQCALPGPSFNTMTLKLEDRPMRDHGYLDLNFRTALEKEWPKNDEAVDRLPKKKPKRTLEVEEAEAEEESARTKKFKSSTSHAIPSGSAQRPVQPQPSNIPSGSAQRPVQPPRPPQPPRPIQPLPRRASTRRRRGDPELSETT